MAFEDWVGLPGRLVVVSGPSGCGKTTIVRKAIERNPSCWKTSVSATTRPPRPGERADYDYFFWPRDRFERERDASRFLEWAEVHGNLYGTPAEPVRLELEQGNRVILVIDVQGALNVKNLVPNALLVFVRTPSIELLESRLRARGTDDESVIRRRLENALKELEFAPRYDRQITNDELDRAVDELAALLSNSARGG